MVWSLAVGKWCVGGGHGGVTEFGDDWPDPFDCRLLHGIGYFFDI